MGNERMYIPSIEYFWKFFTFLLTFYLNDKLSFQLNP